MKYAKLSPKGFGLAGGTLFALAFFFLALWVMAGNSGQEVIDFTSQFYLGYKASLSGAVVGAFWGFLDAGIGCWLFAKLYNYFA